jgi:hypothetical protein
MSVSQELPPHIEIPLGVVVAREAVDSPWATHRWRPVSVFLDAPATTPWRELRRTGQSVHYHAATLQLELHRKETAAYRQNLALPHPSVYVVLREDTSTADAFPLVHLITASPDEVQAYGMAGAETIETVAMPEPLIALVQAFIATHHVEAPFLKRKRQKFHAEDEHKFGQEPLHVLREKAKKAGKPDTQS